MANMTDCRDLDATGWEIPSENYCDQPYVVKTDDGAWLCQMTTGHSREGQPGEHVVSMRSEDQGKTWADLVALEPADGPEAAYGVLLKAPSGRIFCFYNHNTDNRGGSRQPSLQKRQVHTARFAGALRVQVHRRPRAHLVGKAL